MNMEAKVGVAVLALLSLAGAGVARGATPCPGGRFQVQGTNLIRDAGGGSHDTVVLAEPFISIGSGCGPVSAEFGTTKAGVTRVRALFRSCGDSSRVVLLKAEIDPTCRIMNGSLLFRRPRMKRRFDAELSACGGGGAEGEETCTAATAAALSGATTANVAAAPDVASPSGHTVRIPGAGGDAHGKRGHSHAVCTGHGPHCTARVATDDGDGLWYGRPATEGRAAVWDGPDGR